MRTHHLLLPAVLVAVLAAGCGSSAKHEAAATSTTTSSSSTSTTTSTSGVTATTGAPPTTTLTTARASTATTAKPAPTSTTAKPAPTTTTTAVPATAALTVKDFSFNPATLRVAKGTTVTVTNEDGAAHTWTADDLSWNDPLPSGGSASRRFDTAGTFTYHCSIHTSMKGTVIVSG